MPDHGFPVFGLKQAGHRFFDLVEQLVNDAVKLDLYAFTFRGRDCHALNFDIEADHDGIRRACKQNVRLRNRSDCGVDDLEIDFFALDLLQCTDECFE